MKKSLLYFLLLLFASIMLMKFMVNGIIHFYQLRDTETITLIVSGAGRLLLLLGFYLAFKKENFFDLKKVLRNNMGVLIVVGILLFLSLRFSLPYVGTRYSGAKLAAYYTQCFSVGLMEEVLSRWIIFGLVVVAYPKRSVLGQIITASAFFAILHIGNFMMGQTDILSVLNQIIYAFLLGLLFQGLFIQFKNILLIMVLHGLANFHGMYNSIFKLEDNSLTEGNPITDMVQTQLFFGIVCLVLLLILRFTMKKEDVNRLYAL